MNFNTLWKILALVSVVQLADAKTTDTVLIDVYRKFCQNDYKLEDIKKYYDSHPNSINLSSLYFPEYQEEILHKIENDILNIEKWNHVQRIEAFDMMYLQRSKNITKMRKTLMFESSIADIEANRKMREIGFEILQNPKRQSFEDLRQIIAQLNRFDPFLFHSLISEAVYSKIGYSYIEQYQSVVRELPDDFAMKHVLLYYFSFVKSQDNIINQEPQHLKTAYELCARDPMIAYEYGMSLMNEPTYREAEAVFLKIIQKEKYYPVYIDLSLAEIYANFGDNNKAKVYLEKSQEAENYLDTSGREKIISLSKKLNNQSKMWPDIVIWFAVLILGIYFLFKI